MHYAFRETHQDLGTRQTLVLDAFTYNVTWLGVSDLLSQWDINNTTAFSLKLPITAPNSTFLLCVAWEDSAGNAYRYKLWDGGVLHYPLYNGERIEVDAKLEVWSIDNVTAAMSSDLTLYTSWIDDPELCICSQFTPTPTAINVANPSGGSGSSDVIVISGWLAIQGIVELRTLTGYADNQLAYLEFRLLTGDGEGGNFVFDTAETHADDSVDYIKPNDIATADPGRWVRQNNP